MVTEVTEAGSRSVFEVYDAAFGDQPDYAAWRRGIWDRHAARDGFRLARAHDGERLVGFAYGYTGEHGQWWTDQAAALLDVEVAEEWLGGHFELVSIGVLDAVRGQGVGRALLTGLTEGLPQRALGADDDGGRKRPGPPPLRPCGLGGDRAGPARRSGRDGPPSGYGHVIFGFHIA